MCCSSLLGNRRRGIALAELIASFAIAAVIVTIVSQLVVTSRSIVARNSLRQRASEEILNLVEQVSALPYADIASETKWDEFLIRSSDATMSRWQLTLEVSELEREPTDPLNSKRILITLNQGTTQNPILLRTAVWRFSNDLQ